MTSQYQRDEQQWLTQLVHGPGQEQMDQIWEKLGGA